MGCTIEWFQPDQILFVKLTGNIMLGDTHRIDHDLNAYLEQSPHRLHLLFDFANVMEVSMNIYQIRDTASYLQHQRLGCVLLVNVRNHPGSIFASTLMQLAPVEAHFFSDYIEVITFLEKRCAFQK